MSKSFNEVHMKVTRIYDIICWNVWGMVYDISYWLFHQNFIEWAVHMIWTISYGSYWLFNGFLDQLYFPSFFIDLWNIELMIYVKSYIEFISYELYNLSFVEISLLFDINNCLLTIVCWWSYAGDRMLAIMWWSMPLAYEILCLF